MRGWAQNPLTSAVLHVFVPNANGDNNFNHIFVAQLLSDLKPAAPTYACLSL